MGISVGMDDQIRIYLSVNLDGIVNEAFVFLPAPVSQRALNADAAMFSPRPIIRRALPVAFPMDIAAQPKRGIVCRGDLLPNLQGR